MSDLDHNEHNALLREWRVAQFVLLIGFVAALAIGGYFIWQGMQPAPTEVAIQQPQPPAQQSQTPSEADMKANLEVCKTALKHATDFGIIRADSRLAAPAPQGTDVTGRYACMAETEAAKYLIVFDLVCRDLKKEECLNLSSVTQDGGARLYQRAN